MRALLLSMMLLIPGPLFAQEIGAPAAPSNVVEAGFEPVPTVPELEPREQLAKDVEATLDEAERLTANDPEAAKQLLFDLLMSDDPYTVAQRPLFGPRAAELLRKLAKARPSDEVVLSDAAWTASGAADPAHADRLVKAAKAEPDNARALWLARRALQADPNNRDAARLDHKLSNNPLRGVGWSVFWGGVGAAVAGIVFQQMGAGINKTLRAEPHPRDEIDQLIARRNLFATLSLSSFGLAIVGYFSGIGILAAGKRNYEPQSPEGLPAIGEWK